MENRIKFYNNRFEVLASIEYLPSCRVDDKPDVKSSVDILLDKIYAYNPALGRADGDISVFLSDKANPEVKAFIQQNLLKDFTQNESALSIPQELRNKLSGKITDDDIEKFSRGIDESREEYADRLKSFFDYCRYQNAYKKEMKRGEAAIDRLKKLYHIEGS